MFLGLTIKYFMLPPKFLTKRLIYNFLEVYNVTQNTFQIPLVYGGGRKDEDDDVVFKCSVSTQ